MPGSPWTDATGTTLPNWEKVADLMNGACATDGYTAESTRLVSPPPHFTSLHLTPSPLLPDQ